MSNAATPGPWVVYPTEFEDGSEAYDVMADGAAIVIACPPSRADSLLIAAAPDLLAALEYIVGWDPTDWSAEKARDIARAAIRKAKGESP